MKARLAFSTTLVAFIAAGCMTGPDYARPDRAMPKQWSSPRVGGESDASTAVAEWWTTLNDPVLNGLVTRAVESNLDLKAAASRVQEARAARGVAASALWPTLNASAAYARSQIAKPETPSAAPSMTLGATAAGGTLTPSVSVRGNQFSVTRSGASTTATVTPGAQGGVDRQNDLFQAGFDARWELDVFGGNRRAIEAADASIGAAKEAHRVVLVSLLSEVALNYVELRAGQNRMAIVQRNIAAQAESEKLTQDRFKAGLSSELDVVRAHALLTSSQSQVPPLEAQIAASMHRIAILLGQDPGALTQELSATAALPTPPASVPVGLPSDLLSRRPDIRQAERELAAATARTGEATADLYPKFFLTGSAAGQNDTLGSLLNGSNRIWSFGPSIQWPIFQGGRVRSNIEIQKARQEQAALAYEQSVLFALGDVENGLVSFAKEQERRKSLQEAVDANRKAVTLANERYLHGLEDFLSVLQAQQAQLSSEDQLVQSESFALTNLVALYKALGGGWEIHAPESETQTPPAATASR